MNQKNSFIKYIYAALLLAIIFICTAFIKIPMPNISGGYVHLGDTFIYLAASILPFPFALFAAGIGAALADIPAGFSQYAPFTIIIKALMAFCFTAKGKTMLGKRNFIALVFAGLINIVGYYIAQAVLDGNFGSPIASVPFNVIQSVGASVIFVISAAALDKMKIKEHIKL